MKKIKKCIGKFLRGHMMWMYRIYEKAYWASVEKRKKDGLHKLGYSYVKKINEILDKNQIRYFITYGTLLGIIREGKFMEYDDDIDMGIIYDENFSWEKLETALREVGLYKKHQFTLDGKVTEQTYICDNLSIDFFIYEVFDSEHQISYVYFRQEDKRYEDDTFEVSRYITREIKNIKKIKSVSGEFSVPENPERFLEEIYGEDWKIPQPTWKPKRDVVEGKYGYFENK